MNTNTISSAISNLFNNTSDVAANCIRNTSQLLSKVGSKTTEAVIGSVEAAAAITLWLAEMAWWIVTLPVRVVATVILYIAVYFIGRAMQAQMAKAEEELRFKNAKPVGEC